MPNLRARFTCGRVRRSRPPRIALALTAMLAATTGCHGIDLRDLGAWLNAPKSKPLEPSIPLERVEAAMLAEQEGTKELWASGWSFREARGSVLARDFDLLESRLRETQRRFEEGELLETTAWAAFAVFRRNDPEIRDALDDWVAQSPDSWVALYARGAHLTQAGIEARGVEYIRDTDPSQVRTMAELLASARLDLERACDLHPKLTACWNDLLEVHKYMGSSRSVDACARRAIEEMPSTVNVRRTWVQARQPNWGGSYGEMRAIAREALEHVDENALQHLLGGFEHSTLADDAWNNVGCTASIEHWRRALEFGPNPRWNRELGRALWCSHDPEGAIPPLTEAIRFDPWNSRAYYFRGKAHQNRERFEMAIADYDAALRIVPRDAEIHELRGRALQGLGRIDEAYAAFDQAVEIDPTRWVSWEKKGIIESDFRQDWTSAAESFRRQTELQEDSPVAWWNVLLAYRNTEDPRFARAARRYLDLVDPNDETQTEYVAAARGYLAEVETGPPWRGDL